MLRFALCRATLVVGLLMPPAAHACDPASIERLPGVVVFPAYTPEGIRVGTVTAEVTPPLRLERSRLTGQPRTAVFNDPGRLPGAVDPEIERVPLPRVPRFHTRAVYPRGS